MKGIAVIIPVYNGAEMLPTCVESVRRAGERVTEVIIVDDGSTDCTLEVAKALSAADSRIRVIHTENHGSYMARVTGINASTEPYTAFIDVDDRYVPGALDMLAEILEEQDADIAIGGILEKSMPETVDIEERKRETPAEKQKKENASVRMQTPEQIWPRIMKWKTQEFLLYIWHKLYKREMFDGLPVVNGICQGDDVILTCKAFMKAEKTVETTAPVYIYYTNPAGLTHRGFSDSDLDLTRVWDNVVQMMEDQPSVCNMEPTLTDLARYNRWRTDFTLISRLVLTDDREADRKYDNELKKWRKGLEKHWRDLIRPHAMPRNRELLIIGFRFFFTPTKVLIRLGRRLTRKDVGLLLHSGDKR